MRGPHRHGDDIYPKSFLTSAARRSRYDSSISSSFTKPLTRAFDGDA